MISGRKCLPNKNKLGHTLYDRGNKANNKASRCKKASRYREVSKRRGPVCVKKPADPKKPIVICHNY